MTVLRPPQQGLHRSLRFVVPPLLVVAVLAGLLLFVDPEAAPELDADLCPISPDAIVQRAVLLMDLRKPALAATNGRSLAKDALQAVSAEIGIGTELAVVAVSSDVGAALQPIARLCKPYDSLEQKAASAPEGTDCADWPTDFTARDENAMRFCARRADLGRRIDDLMAQPSAPVENAFVVEAIEEVSLSLADEPRQKSLYVFSDLLQHADWYSHVELGSDSWDFADYVSAREQQDPQLGPRPPPVAGLAATLFYVPRQGSTDAPGAKATHLRFWRDYFADSTGRAPRLVELPTAQSYTATPLMNRLSAVEAVTLERQRLQREREAAERDLARLAQARAELEAMRKRALERRRQLEANEAVPPVEERPMPTVAFGEGASSAPIAAVEPALPPAAEVAFAPPEPLEKDLAAEVRAVASPAPAPSPCDADLMPRFALRAPAYPGRYRVNYGSATVTLSYTVDEQGDTEDDSVEIVADTSSATKPAFFDLFADQARNTVERYRYEFDELGDSACERRQQLTRRFVFQYDR